MLMRSPLARDRRQPPGFIRPCQPVLSLKVPVGDGWIHELKHDGFRVIALKDGDEVRLWSRNGRNWWPPRKRLERLHHFGYSHVHRARYDYPELKRRAQALAQQLRPRSS
jgi:hypothetical protein